MKETQSEFIKGYCEKDGITEKELNNEYGKFAIPCDCEDGGGDGHWAMIRRSSLEHQVEFCINNQ